MQFLVNRLKVLLEDLAVEQNEAYAAMEIPFLKQSAIRKIKVLDRKMAGLQEEINKYEDLLNSLD